jgi:hypothetical protein
MKAASNSAKRNASTELNMRFPCSRLVGMNNKVGDASTSDLRRDNV